ncbi:uncharacterized protein FOMMEDRAFT_168177, partial [Fomitiporia mediterranea MF3/22]|uniref:uncharacterized protein n=1 Tax=Fomitiporia mediterranea (strain MF3/22) TaxID=694068 RepID=UPI000440855B
MLVQRLALAVGTIVPFVFCRETVRDAALLARQLVASPQAIGVMATIFPANTNLQGEPFALQEYYASCYSNGSLSLITMPISRHTRNIRHSPTHSASMTVWSSPPAASRARVSLIGNVTFLETSFAVNSGIQDCYLEHHPDAKWWLPDDPDGAHEAYWARFDPHSVFFVGGFGDKHYIGDIPLDLFQSIEPAGIQSGTEIGDDRLFVQGRL